MPARALAYVAHHAGRDGDAAPRHHRGARRRVPRAGRHARIDRRDHAGVRGQRACARRSRSTSRTSSSTRSIRTSPNCCRRKSATAMDAAPRQSGDELIALYRSPDRALARRRERPAARRGLVLGAAARDAGVLRGAVGAVGASTTCRSTCHILETKLQRVLGRREVRQVARPLRPRPGPPGRAHDGDPRDLDRRRRHRAARRAPAAPSRTTPCATCASAAGSCRSASCATPACRSALGTDEMNTDDSVNLWFAAKTAALLHTLSEHDYREWPDAGGDPRSAAARRRAGACGVRSDIGRLAPATRQTSRCSTSTRWRSRRCNDLRRQLVMCEDGSSVR